MSANTEISGILVIDKPAGITSHDVVAAARRLLGMKQVGHFGTLDPFATGVLPLSVGKATRFAQFYLKSRKAYEGAMRFGFATDTYDATGQPAADPAPVDFERSAIRVSVSFAMVPQVAEVLAKLSQREHATGDDDLVFPGDFGT